MHDIGGLVWIVFVLFAVISSIVRSARRSRTDARGGSSPSSVNRSPETPARARVIAQFHQQAQPVMQPPQQQQAQRIPQAAPQPVPAPPQISQPPPPAAPRLVVPAQPQRRTTAFFADRGALIRGIVAAEVLGKPLALRDE